MRVATRARVIVRTFAPYFKFLRMQPSATHVRSYGAEARLPVTKVLSRVQVCQFLPGRTASRGGSETERAIAASGFARPPYVLRIGNPSERSEGPEEPPEGTRVPQAMHAGKGPWATCENIYALYAHRDGAEFNMSYGTYCTKCRRYIDLPDQPVNEKWQCKCEKPALSEGRAMPVKREFFDEAAPINQAVWDSVRRA